MEKTLFVDPNELEEHKKASALIPEMTDKEWKDFLKNVEEFGIRKPLDVTKDYKILDGRHRAKAAKKLNIESVEVNVHDLSEQEIIKWVRDISIEQKILSPAQKHKIFTDAEDFMSELHKKSKKKKIEGNERGGKNRHKLGRGSLDPQPKHNTNDEIGKMIGVSGTTVKRLNAVKKKDPELYEEVVKGDKSAKGAYMELHPPRNKKDKTVDKPATNNNQQPPKLSQEEIDRQMFDADVSNLFMHLNELTGFVGRTEKLKEVVNEAMKKDNATMIDHIKALEEILNLTKTEAI